MTNFQVALISLAAISATGALIGIVIGILRVGAWKGAVDSDREAFKGFMIEIRNKIDKIFTRLPPLPVASSSPLCLTELGERISDCVDGRTLAGRLAHELLEKVKDKSAYEVQEFCGKYMQEEFEPTPGQITKFGDCAYENGVKVEQVKEVIAIELKAPLKIRGGFAA